MTPIKPTFFKAELHPPTTCPRDSSSPQCVQIDEFLIPHFFAFVPLGSVLLKYRIVK